jgi:hypothetical protein
MKNKFLIVGAALLTLALLGVAIMPVLAGGGANGWTMFAINGGGQVVTNQAAYHNSTIQFQKKTLTLAQTFDPSFESESPVETYPAAEQYNNAFLVGYQGYQPTTKKDVVWSFDFKVDPGFYGTTGFEIEHKDTFNSSGGFQGPQFDFFGVTYVGPDNFMGGLSCMYIVNAQPVGVQPLSVDPFKWNTYEIRFHRLDASSTLASVRVNGQPGCEMTIADLGETEVQVWADNYQVGVDENWNPIRGYQTQPEPQSVSFRNVTVKMKK